MNKSQRAGSQPSEGFSWTEMQAYWRNHAADRVDVDFESDPDALANVCYVGQPQWWNEHHARAQRMVFDDLLGAMSSESPGAALDVGCGAGRWSRRLADSGFEVTGIDLQESLIERNRLRYPQLKFETRSLQDFRSDTQFDLICSVTVIQHVPQHEQEVMVRRMAELLKPGGHALILENVRDHASHVFARTERDWIALFGEHGFTPLALRRYDYNPATLMLSRAMRQVRRVMSHESESARPLGGYTPAPEPDGGAIRPTRRVRKVVQTVARRIDIFAEPAMVRTQPARAAGHAGIAFSRN